LSVELSEFGRKLDEREESFDEVDEEFFSTRFFFSCVKDEEYDDRGKLLSLKK